MIEMKKFLKLKELLFDNTLGGFIPPFIVYNRAGLSDIPHYPLIVRSCLDGEALDQLHSGQSLSVADLKTRSELNSALEQVMVQDDLYEVIIQKYIACEQLWTLYLHGDFVFAESRNGDIVVVSKDFVHGSSDSYRIWKKIVTLLREKFPTENLLLEIGVDSSQNPWLFQVVDFPAQMVGQVFHHQTLWQLLTKQMQTTRRKGLIDFLKTEFQNFKLRQLYRDPESVQYGPDLAFANWRAFFDYFFYYCQKEKLGGNQDDLASFLSLLMSGRKGWPFNLAKTHLLISSRSDSLEELSAEFLLESKGPLYIGKGQLSVNKAQVTFIENLSMKSVSQLSKEESNGAIGV